MSFYSWVELICLFRYSDVTWALTYLKSLDTELFVKQLFKAYCRESIKLRITRISWDDFIDDRWIVLTKNAFPFNDVITCHHFVCDHPCPILSHVACLSLSATGVLRHSTSFIQSGNDILGERLDPYPKCRVGKTFEWGMYAARILTLNQMVVFLIEFSICSLLSN